jgi:hypothetical protein
VRVTLTNLPADYDLKLYRSSTLVGTSANGGTTSESLIYNNTRAATTYTAYVYGYNGAFNATSCYTIRAEISGTSFVRQSGEEVEILNAELTDEALQVYPNPSNGNNVNISISGVHNKSLIILTLSNSTGAEVYNSNLTAASDFANVQLQTSELANGIYYLQIIIDGEITNQKVVVSNR